MEELIKYLSDMRGYYAPDNRVGLHIDDLIADLRDGAPREKTLADAAAIQDDHPGTTICKAIDRVKTLLA